MLLKEDIIKSISEMDISELIWLKNIIQNIKRARHQDRTGTTAGAIKTRSALQGVSLSDDIQALREERI